MIRPPAAPAILVLAIAALLPAAVAPPPAGDAGGATRGGGGGLRWPVDLPPAIASTFGEYRYDHLHAGVDIGTGGGSGHPVRAAAAGAIYRLKVEWRGYGRALYLRHADGRSTVYGHLERYEEAVLGLETRVRRRRAEAGTPWPGDIFIDPPIAVGRGQVIALSGESGVGLPHLHFEVRGPADDPIDPFRAGLEPPPDREPPTVEAILLTAAAPATLIDGSWRERTVALGRRDPAARVEVDGPFLASLAAWDRAGGGRAGLRAVETLVDGAPCYRFENPGFRFEQYPIAGLIYDHRHSHLGPTRMAWRLGRLPGNLFARDGCAAAGAPPGALELAPGRHRLDLIATDAAGLARRAAVDIEVVAPARREPPPSPVRDPGAPAGAGAPRAEARFFPGFMEIVIPRTAGSGGPPLDACGPAAGNSWVTLDGGALAGVALDYESAASLGVEVAAGRVAGACPLRDPLAAVALAVARADAPLRLVAGAAQVEIPAGGRFFAGPVAVGRRPAREVPEGLRAVGDAVDILPEGEALDARALLSIGFAAAEDPRRLGIYRWDGVTGRWSLEGDAIGPEGDVVQSRFRRYGRFALLADESPPRLADIRPRAGATTGRRPAIEARVTDVGKGLGWDGVTFLLDGREVPAEYDPDRGTVRPFAAPTLAPGRHRLAVGAIDRSGHATDPVVIDFTVR